MVTAQTLERSEKLNVKRFNELSLKVDNTRGWVAAMARNPDRFAGLVSEQIDQLIEMFLLHFVELDKKYELLERGIDLLSDIEFEEALSVVRSKLGADTMIPPLPRETLEKLIRVEQKKVPGNAMIAIYLPVIFAERFQRAYLVPLPDPETGTMIDMKPMDVCYNSVTQNYFRMEGLKYQQVTRDLIVVENAVFESAKQRSECFTAHLFGKNSETNRVCKKFRDTVAQGPNEIYALALPGHNQFLISTTRPETVVIQCGIDIRPMARERVSKVTTAVIVTNSGCRINTLTGFIVTDPTIHTDIKLTKIFLSPMKLPTYREVPPRAMNLTPWGTEDIGQGLENALEEIYPEDMNYDTDWNLVTGISVPSILLVLTIAIVLGIYCHRSRNEPIQADAELIEIPSPAVTVPQELAQVDSTADPSVSRREPEYETRDEDRFRFPVAPTRFSFTIKE